MALYYCTYGDLNTCPKKELCMRYKEDSDKDNPLPFTTLYKEMCNENNQYILFIENTEKQENSTEKLTKHAEIRGEDS